MTYLENSGPEGQISSYDYTLGPAGNRKKIVEHNGDVCEYEYDKLYRLTRESRTGDNAYWIEYTYDAFGNRTEMNTGGMTTTYTYDHNDRLLSESGPAGITSYSWDDNGNMTGKDKPDEDWVYDWNHDNKMVVAEKDGVLAASYSYDFRGERIHKATASDKTAFLIDNNNQTGYSQTLRETDGSNAEKVAYTFGDDLISQKREEVSYLHYDGLGSTRALTSMAAEATDTFSYLAFGSILNRTGTTTLSHLFTGEIYDFNIGYYYLRARLYNPFSGLFLSIDPLFCSFEYNKLHKYVYGNNDPLNKMDINGLEWTLASKIFALSISIILITLAVGYYFFKPYLSLAECKKPQYAISSTTHSNEFNRIREAMNIESETYNFACAKTYSINDMRYCPHISEDSLAQELFGTIYLSPRLFEHEGPAFYCTISHELCHAIPPRYGECRAYENSYLCSQYYEYEHGINVSCSEGRNNSCNWVEDICGD